MACAVLHRFHILYISLACDSYYKWNYYMRYKDLII